MEIHIFDDFSFNKLLKQVLCPEFNVFPSASLSNDIKDIVFYRFLKEQECILDFMEGQQTAAINGSAGTGKTMIALEKARRNSANGDKVLFLCYNVKLQEFLARKYPEKNVDYFTIDGFICKLTQSPYADYKTAKPLLENMYYSHKFPYKHVIVDEGQDFGKQEVEETNILELLKLNVTFDENGTFYVFYDKLQMVQSDKIPSYIENPDCKLTLYRNCRNTENIAKTSLKPISNKPPRLFEDSITGVPVNIKYFNDEDAINDAVIQNIIELKRNGYKDIVVLTCKTEETSCISDKVKDDISRRNVQFTTCRKFKGLEADAVILIDVERDTFYGDHKLIYYVGASRAKFSLDILSAITDQECAAVLANDFGIKNAKMPKREFAKALNAIGTNR